MKLMTVVQPECIAAGFDPAEKEEMLGRIAHLAVQAPALKALDEQAVLEGLRRREQLGSTGFGDGVAIPHCRLEGAEDFVVGLASVPAGTDFDAVDGRPVRLIVFMVAPQRESDEHIRLLSGISQVLSIPGAVDELASAGSAETLRESFLRHVRDEQAEDRQETARSLIQLVVQDEALFEDLLQALASVESSSVVVLSGENTTAYLSRIPLFADMWRDQPNRFNRVILAVVGKQMTNETIRRLERVTGSLAERNDVMILVQDVLYAAGGVGRWR